MLSLNHQRTVMLYRTGLSSAACILTANQPVIRKADRRFYSSNSATNHRESEIDLAKN